MHLTLADQIKKLPLERIQLKDIPTEEVEQALKSLERAIYVFKGEVAPGYVWKETDLTEVEKRSPLKIHGLFIKTHKCPT